MTIFNQFELQTVSTTRSRINIEDQQITTQRHHAFSNKVGTRCLSRYLMYKRSSLTDVRTCIYLHGMPYDYKNQFLESVFKII